MGSRQWTVNCGLYSGQRTENSCQFAVNSGQLAMNSGQWTMGSAQWAMGSGQWIVHSGQWAVHSVQWAITVGSGQWTFKFGLAIFGSVTKYSLHFASNIRLKRKFASGLNSFRI